MKKVLLLLMIVAIMVSFTSIISAQDYRSKPLWHCFVYGFGEDPVFGNYYSSGSVPVVRIGEKDYMLVGGLISAWGCIRVVTYSVDEYNFPENTEIFYRLTESGNVVDENTMTYGEFLAAHRYYVTSRIDTRMENRLMNFVAEVGYRLDGQEYTTDKFSFSLYPVETWDEYKVMFEEATQTCWGVDSHENDGCGHSDIINDDGGIDDSRAVNPNNQSSTTKFTTTVLEKIQNIFLSLGYFFSNLF